MPPNVYTNSNFQLTSVFSSSSLALKYLPMVEYYYPANLQISGLSVIATWDGTQWISTSTVPGYPSIPLVPGLNVGDKYSEYFIGYSSYSSSQPPIKYEFTSNITDLNPVTVRARPIFLLDGTPTYTGTSNIGSTQTLVIQAVDYSVAKSYQLTTGTTQATGPSHPFTVTLVVTVGNGVVISDMVVQDVLPPALRYVSALPAPSSVSGQQIVWNAGLRSGPASTYTYVITVYAADVYSDSGLPVIEPVNPQSVVISSNDATLSDGTTLLTTSNTVNIPLSPISIGKAVVNTSVLPPYQGSLLKYTVGIWTSDYFSMNNIMLVDRLSLGQTFQPNVTLNGTPFSGYTIVPLSPTPPPPYYPSTEVVFNLPSGPYIELVYYTQLTGVYNTEILCLEDYVNNTISLTADNAIGGSVTENAAAKYTYPSPIPSKSLYAYNGIPIVSPPANVFPGDVLTYKLTLTLPTNNYLNLKIYDFLPSPIVSATQFPVNPSINPSGIPPAGQISYAPDNTPLYPSPIVTVDNVTNSIAFDYGTYLSLPDDARTISILVSAVVNSQPYQPGLVFADQMYYSLNNQVGDDITNFTSFPLVLGNPDLYIKKTVVDSLPLRTIPNNAALVDEFGAAGSLVLGTGFTPITVPYFDSLIPSNMTGANSGDLVRFAVIVTNKGTSDAYDVVISDMVPNAFTTPFTWLKFYDQNGTSFVFSYFIIANTYFFNIPFPIQPGNSVFLICEFYVPESFDYCNGLTNEGTITGWSNQLGGTNFVTALGYNRTSIVTVKYQNITSTITTIQTPPDPDLPVLPSVTLGETVTQTLTYTMPDITINNAVLTISTNTDIGIFPLGIVFNNVSITGSITPIVTPTSMVYNLGDVTSSVQNGTMAISYILSFNSDNFDLEAGYQPTVNAMLNVGTCNIINNSILTIVEPNIVITKSIKSVVNNLVTYDISIANNGNSTAFSVRIIDTPPVQFISNLTLVTWSPGSYTVTPLGNLQLSVVEPVTPGTEIIMTVQGTFDPNTSYGTEITNNACVTYQSYIAEGSRIYGPACSSITFFNGLYLTVESSNWTYGGHTADYGSDRGVVGAPGEVIRLRYRIFLPTVGIAQVNFIQTTGLLGLESQGGDSYVISLYNEEDNVFYTGVRATFDHNTVLFDGFPTLSNIDQETDMIYWDYFFRISNNLTNIAGKAYNPISSGTFGSPAIVIQIPTPPIADFTVVEPELTITKSDALTPIISGVPITYTINVANPKTEWSCSAWDVLISDKINNILTSPIISNLLPPTASDVTVYYPEVRDIKLLPDEVISFNLTATPVFNLQGQLCNTASAEWKSTTDTSYARTGYDGPIGINNYYVQHTTCANLIPIGLQKTIITKSPYVLGQTILYGIVVTLPPGVNNVTVSDSFSGQNYLTASIITLASESYGLLTGDFEGIVTPLVVNSNIVLETQATVYSDAVYSSILILVEMELTGNFENTATFHGITSSVSGTISKPDLYVKKFRLTDPVISNKPICYRVEMGHTVLSQSAAYNVQLVDTPSQIGSYVSVNAYTIPPVPISVVGGNVDVPVLPNGTIVILEYCLTLPDPYLLNGSNTAIVTWNDGGTVQDSNSYVIGPPDLFISKTTPSPNVQVGDMIIWNIAVTNSGDSTAVNVDIFDPIPPVYFGAPTDPGWVISGSDYKYTVPEIAPMQTVTVTLMYRLLSAGAVSYPNMARLVNGRNNTATIYINGHDLFSRLVVRKYLIGGNLKTSAIYRISITNIGSDVFNDTITIKDIFSAPLEWNGAGPWISNGNGVSVTQLVSIQPGQTVNYNITFRIISNKCPIINTVILYNSTGDEIGRDTESSTSCSTRNGCICEL